MNSTATLEAVGDHRLRMAEYFEYVKQWDSDRQEKGWWHSFELLDGTCIEGVCSLEGLKHRLAQFPIASNLRGKRVLDIGCWDGWFSFELERRGAEVMAIDCWDNPRFRQMHATYHSKVDYRQMDMYELTPQAIGRFDIVLFLGVLYHLKHPLLALERVCALSKDVALVDSFILREEHLRGEPLEGELSTRPMMQFFETDEFGGQTDNWSGPNLPCLLAMCRTAGFARVQLQSVLDYSACVACYRRWEESAGTAEPPELTDAAHMGNFGINFSSNRDEYISAWFTCNRNALSLDDVKPEVGGYGVRPISLNRQDDGLWQVNFKLPPVDTGWQDVCVRIGDSKRSNCRRIAVDVPLDVSRLRLRGIKDGATWKVNELDLSKGSVLSVWLSGLPEHADRANIRATLGNVPLDVLYVEPLKTERPASLWERLRGTPRQLNLGLPSGCQLTPEMPLLVTIGGRTVRQGSIRIQRGGSVLAHA